MQSRVVVGAIHGDIDPAPPYGIDIWGLELKGGAPVYGRFVINSAGPRESWGTSFQLTRKNPLDWIVP